MSHAVSSTAHAAQNMSFDFVIIGAGTAGLPAAIFASRRGAKVLLIYAAPVVGGTLHLANGQVSAGGTTLQKAKGIVDTPDKHFDDIVKITRGKADDNIVRLTVDHAPATINWLLGAGLVPLPDHPVTGDSPGRPAYTTPRYLDLAAGRLQVALASISGAVVGVRARTGNEERAYHGRHVLLTTGGYAMNSELFQKLIGAPSYTVGSYPYALGDGLKLVTDIGGSTRGRELHRAGPGSILSSELFPAKFYARFNLTPQIRQPWEIWVNNSGQRFVREDEPLTYERERGLATQEDFRYAVVFDDEIFANAPLGMTSWTREKTIEHFNAHPMFHRADTLDELARKARINPDGLKQTVAAYNANVASGQDAFGRKHMPRPIAKPPYYAITHLGHSATSAIGVTLDNKLRVTRVDGTPIAGLYAAGEVMGSGSTLGDAFAPGMMLTPALSLGRWLGQTLLIG